MLVGEAIATLVNAGFTVDPVILYAFSSSIAVGNVVSQTPPAGSMIPYQSMPVQLTVSAGVAPTAGEVMVPNLVGMTLLPATNALSASELNLGMVMYLQSDSYAVNEVTAQSIASGTSVQSFTTVNLTVCSGPPYADPFTDSVTVPDVVG